ncbi:hypothetical protein D3C71_393860 [compost metagenome]
MKIVTAFLFSSLVFFTFCQQQLKDLDTTLDYKERFYKNEKLITTNLWRYVYPNTNGLSIAAEDIYLNPHLDTSKMEREQDGLWVEYFDKKWNEVDSSNYYYRILCEYDCGYTVGKVYYFRKNEIMHTALRYPELNDSVFDGFRKIIYDKGRISWVEYSFFSGDSLKNQYYNMASYFPDGQLKDYSLSDDHNYQYKSTRYNKAGLCIYELKLNRNESYIIKRKRKGRKEIIDIRENGVFTRTVKVDGKEVRQRKHK